MPAKQAEAHATAQADVLTHHFLSDVATKADVLQFVLLGGLMVMFRFIG